MKRIKFVGLDVHAETGGRLFALHRILFYLDVSAGMLRQCEPNRREHES